MSITLGTPIFSALTGRFPRRGLILSLMGLFTATNLAIWGLFGFAEPPIMQGGAVKVASTVAPDAIPTASGLNVSAFNLGIFAGSFIGGRVVEGPGLTATPYAAIAIATVALGITFLIGKSRSLRAAESIAG